MNICCGDYTEIGCVSACDPLPYGTATADGEYTLILSSGLVYKQTFTSGDPLLFNVPLNEDYYYTAKRINPSGAESCFKFKTYAAVVING